ncbi:MAG: hypothetical protein ACFFAH_03755 [Promethearchaeota archaeon]
MSEKQKKPESSQKTREVEGDLDDDRKTSKKEEQKEKISKPVIIKAEAYKTIILYSSRYANKSIPPGQWKEIYGILIGFTDDDFVYVERAEALTFGHSTDVQLDNKHYVFIAEIEDKIYEEGKGRYIVGWFHSHPGLGLFFSYIDLINQIGFQGKNENAIGLVFDHTLLGKKKKEKIGENYLTKYDTGFEIYRMIDIEMDRESKHFESNYHKVDYVVDGLNKFFFANVLSELSALVSAGKPLQVAYGEENELQSSYQEPSEIIQHPQTKESTRENINSFSEGILEEIPISEDIKFDVDDLFYDDLSNKIKETTRLKETAEESVYEGNLAFKNKDTFMGVEKYSEGIKIYKKLKDYDRVLELLKILSEQCIISNHQKLAEDFAEELYDISVKRNNLFYRGVANYLIGSLMLKRRDHTLLEDALIKIQDAAIDYGKVGDFAGAGLCFNKIGTIYQTRLNQSYNAALHYEEAMRNLNKAILRGHPLRKSLWSKPESLSQKILEIKDIVEELISRIENLEEKEKIKKDLNSIQFNF